MLTNQSQMHLKQLQKQQFKNKSETIWFVITFIIKLQKSKKFTTGYFRQWEVKRKYQKKDIYLQKKDRKIMMNSD